MASFLLMSGHAEDYGGADGQEAGHEGGTDVDFGGLAGRDLAAMRTPNALRYHIFASTRHRA
ncbi:hypothetical protein [Jannaschia seosinensis]|uniref:hypothetical protein n=1 Tax=Jannaschia seosinensis TaxID=313367 RepID=UPI0006E31751|nr:hypothetical protein [Jannaschia seosinensis]